MNKQENKKSLDQFIQHAIGRENLTFDFDKWKQNHQKEIHQFQSQIKLHGVPAPVRTEIWRKITKSKTSKLAAAAAIIIAVSLLIVYVSIDKQSNTAKVTEARKSPAELTSFGTLTFAYHRGGIEEVEEIFDKALKMAGPRPARISMQELFEEHNGENPERTKL